MTAEKKVVKGGFRATLVLIASIIALILAIVAFNRTGGEADLKAQIGELSTKLETMKQETGKVLEKVGIEVRKVDKEQK
jgi:hypothetical protein